MSDALSNFNDMVNSALDPILGNQYISAALKLFLVLYGGLGAPKVPVRFGPIFTNSYSRMAVMALMLWTANKDPALSLMVAVTWFLTMNYVVKNSLLEVQQTGIVSPDIAITISGGSGPSIKSSSTIQAEASLMQASVDSGKAPGFVTPPEAVLTSGPVSTGSVAAIPTSPSGNSAANPSMMAITPEGASDVPLAFTPSEIQDLAFAPA